jgi:hypothetical protein
VEAISKPILLLLLATEPGQVPKRLFVIQRGAIAKQNAMKWYSVRKKPTAKNLLASLSE